MCYCCYSLCSAPGDDVLQMDLEFSEELHRQAKTKKLRYSIDLLRFFKTSGCDANLCQHRQLCCAALGASFPSNLELTYLNKLAKMYAKQLPCEVA